MLIIDCHLDLAWNALGWNRDLRVSAHETRAMEAGLVEQGHGRGMGTVSFPDLRRGRVGICVGTLLARKNARGNYNNLDFRSQEIACAVARGQLAYYRQLEEDGVSRVLTDIGQFETAYGAWLDDDATEPLGFIISMEGADPILSPGQLERWYREGLRAIGLAHYGPSAYAHGTGCTGPLTPAGREMLQGMEELEMILDLTHLCDESFWEAVKLFKGSVWASHNNCRAITPGDRQFDDDQIRCIIERGGVIGAALDNWMIVPDWREREVTLAHVVDHMDHICQLAGNAKHVAIGSDLDGGFGREQSPGDLDTIADMQAFAPLLRWRSYSEEDIAAVFHGNWARVIRGAW
ncbi:MAG: Zn-dependent dipeptidase microsomal dipeptidase [Bryobacterales bacterium]|nr:Zn-dependent dipeptidase microsomal dipeptidase [Bryobacterales bacterium]